MAGGVFTTDDLESMRTAIMDLASGNAQLVQISGRMYRKSNLDELRRTYDWALSAVNRASGRGVERLSFKATSNQDDN